jgi:hypothetical protein
MVLRVGQGEATVEEIDGSLESMQKIVGGYVEPVIMPGSITMVCNEEGKLLGLPTNFNYLRDPIAGDVFFARDDPGTGEFVSLTDDDVSKLTKFQRWLRTFDGSPNPSFGGSR